MRSWNGFRIALLVLIAAVGKPVFAAPIDEVKITGVGSDMQDILRTMSGFLPGDEVEPVRLERATAKLKDYFESKGYPAATISSETVRVKKDAQEDEEKTALVFHVVPGKGIRIAAVDYSSDNPDLTPAMKEKITKAVEFKPGELDDRDRVKEMRREIEGVLASLNFVDSKVVDVKTEGVTGGVKLTFEIELGQRVIFSVYGNEYFTRTELMAQIEEQRSLGLGRDYVNVILNRLHDHYVDYGFKDVEITPYVFEPRNFDPRKVVYHITEGPKVYIDRLTFDGNENFTQSQLENIYYGAASSRIQAKIYNAKMVDDAARAMIGELKNRGFLSAKLIAIKTEEADDSHNVEIRIFIHEGLQTHVQSIDFHNNRILTSERLTEILGLKEGDPLSLLQLENGLDRIKREYRNLGRLNVSVSNEATNSIVTYSEKNQYAYLNFEIVEGPEFRLGTVQIFGNEVTRRSVIEREIRVKPGEPLAENKLLETEDRLRRLGIFSQVTLELQDDPTEATTKNMKLSVQEATPGNMSTAIGFRNDLGLRLSGEVGYNNLWGLDHSWIFDLTGNRRITDFRFTEFNAQVSYIWPYFIFGETTFRPSLSIERRQFLEFSAETYAFSSSFERMLFKPWKLAGVLTYTLEQIRQFDAVDASQNQQVRIGSITPLLRVDLRDNPLVPRSGFFGLTSFEFANTWLGSQSDPVPLSYGRFQARTDYYADFLPRVIWYTSIRGGWLRNFTSPYNADGSFNALDSIPLIKQFALGGINSLRGYLDQEVNVQSGDPKRRVYNFSTYVNYRTQMDFLVSPNLSFGPFLDAGNLQVDNFSFGNLRYGTGVGMRYLTPVGPVNFDWGFKMFPKNGEATNEFYFSLGVI